MTSSIARGTLVNAADALLDNGAVSVSAYVAHGVLSNGACKQVQESGMAELVVTDSIDPAMRTGPCDKVRAISVAALMGDAIWRIANEQSVSVLFSSAAALPDFLTRQRPVQRTANSAPPFPFRASHAR